MTSSSRDIDSAMLGHAPTPTLTLVSNYLIRCVSYFTPTNPPTFPHDFEVLGAEFGAEFEADPASNQTFSLENVKLYPYLKVNHHF